MKYIRFFALLLLCPTVKSQSIAVNTVDKETGVRTIITNNHAGTEVKPEDTVARSGLLFFSAGYQEIKAKNTETYFIELNFVHHDARLGCLENGTSKAIITLEDGTLMECTQISDTDCDNIGFVAGFALMPKNSALTAMKHNFEKLLTTEISKIEVFTTEKPVLFIIKTKSKAYIRSHFALLNKTIAQAH